jgi:hypothetical protein
MDAATCCRLLDLPAEMRLLIYSYVVPDIPLSVPRAQYQGLVYTCKQTRNELEPEIFQAMRSVFTKITQEICERFDDDITFSTFHSFRELENIQIKARLSWRIKERHALNYRDFHPIRKLLDFHFDAVTIYIKCKPGPDNGYYAKPPCAWFMDWIVKPFFKRPERVAIKLKSLVVDHTEELTCSHARVIRVSRISASRILNSKIWDIKHYKNDDGQEVAFRLMRCSDSTTPDEQIPFEGHESDRHPTLIHGRSLLRRQPL